MIDTEVYKRNPTRFTTYGAALPTTVELLRDASISEGLAQRLVSYANDRMNEAGFESMMLGASVTAYTLDGHSSPADRIYTVRYTNSKGGYIEVSGIMTRKGWPSLDHGFDINHRPV